MVKKKKNDVTVTKSMLSDMYHKDKMSIRKIASELGATRGQIEHLMNVWNIPRRSNSEAQRVNADVKGDMVKEVALQKVTALATKCKVDIDIPTTKRSNLLVPYPLTSNKDAWVTVVLSDLHIGDGSHLPNTYWSTINNMCLVLEYITKMYNVKGAYFVLNGDIVNGRDIYRFQELRNIIQRGHWQVFVAEKILKDSISKFNKHLRFNRTFFARGTHETESSNSILFLKRVMDGETSYLGHGGYVNIAGDLGEYNVVFTHGTGYSNTSPVSTKLINDMISAINLYAKNGVTIERLCSSHSHWLSTNLIIQDLNWDVTGGFQKWEYTIGQRPCGGLIYLYCDGECCGIPVRPNYKVEMDEKTCHDLEYKNFSYYGKYFMKHLSEVEGVKD